MAGYAVLGWVGGLHGVPAAHVIWSAFGRLTLLGLFAVGLRFGGQRLGAVLAFAWAAYPFTQYVSNSNTNDAIMPCFLVWASGSPRGPRLAASSRRCRAGRSSRPCSSPRSGSRIPAGGRAGASRWAL